MVQRDIVALNRMYLVMAREAAKMRSGEMLTGLTRDVLDMLADMSIEEIERLARDAGASLIALRINSENIKKIIELDTERRKAYAGILFSN